MKAKLILSGVAVMLSVTTHSVKADSPPIFYPPKPDEKLFSALRETSPFLRTLNISETYALRAVAKYENIAYARVYNKETKKTITIEIGAKPNQGIELIKIIEPQKDNLSSVAARISFAGEIAELKYDPVQINPANRPSAAGKADAGRDQKGSSQDRQKYHTLSEDRKTKLREYIKATMKKYPKMPREERGNLIRGALQKLSDGRDIDIPK